MIAHQNATAGGSRPKSDSERGNYAWGENSHCDSQLVACNDGTTDLCEDESGFSHYSPLPWNPFAFTFRANLAFVERNADGDDANSDALYGRIYSVSTVITETK